jgi:hypothetical protein
MDSNRNTGKFPLRQWRTALLLGSGIVLVLLVILLGVGVYLDYRNFDRTSGGYDPPYTDWTGTPIDWTATETTGEGFRQNGRIIRSRLNCTTGMITFEVATVSFDYRVVSPRAIAVHRPREDCQEAGFSPRF